jgi:hypothetical protein
MTVVTYVNVISKNIPAGNKEAHGVHSKDRKIPAKNLKSMECEARMVTI